MGRLTSWYPLPLLRSCVTIARVTPFRLKLALALVLGALVGVSYHWLAGAFLFASLATAVTLMRVRNEVREMRETFEDPA